MADARASGGDLRAGRDGAGGNANANRGDWRAGGAANAGAGGGGWRGGRRGGQRGGGAANADAGAGGGGRRGSGGGRRDGGPASTSSPASTSGPANAGGAANADKAILKTAYGGHLHEIRDLTGKIKDLDYEQKSLLRGLDVKQNRIEDAFDAQIKKLREQLAIEKRLIKDEKEGLIEQFKSQFDKLNAEKTRKSRPSIILKNQQAQSIRHLVI